MLGNLFFKQRWALLFIHIHFAVKDFHKLKEKTIQTNLAMYIKGYWLLVASHRTKQNRIHVTFGQPFFADMC